ncbi:hypothetical protein NL676_027203 [Syzygium grande]|nr:hypothetical protein NL676_027203 [Syzygium grande]
MASPGFFLICVLHSLVALTTGALMMFYSAEISAIKSQGSTPHDQLLIRTSDSFSGLLLVAIGSLLLMVAFVKDREFQSFFAKGCMVLHVGMAVWRFCFERKLEELVESFRRCPFLNPAFCRSAAAVESSPPAIAKTEA